MRLCLLLIGVIHGWMREWKNVALDMLRAKFDVTNSMGDYDVAFHLAKKNNPAIMGARDASAFRDLEQCLSDYSFDSCFTIDDTSFRPNDITNFCVQDDMMGCRIPILRAYFAGLLHERYTENVDMCEAWALFGLRTRTITNAFFQGVDDVEDFRDAQHMNATGILSWWDSPPMLVLQPEVDGRTLTWYVGAHKSASDLGPDIEDVILFEPAKEFFDELLQNAQNHKLGKWDKPSTIYHERAEERQDIILENFGLGKTSHIANSKAGSMQTSNLNLIEILAHGPTVIKSETTENSNLHIKSVEQYFSESPAITNRIDKGRAIALDVLYINCIGCEYEIIHALADSNLLQHIGVIQFLSFIALTDHELDECMVKERDFVTEHGPDIRLLLDIAIPKICKLQTTLSKHHTREYGSAWFLQRWTNKKLWEMERRDDEMVSRKNIITRSWA